MDTRRSPMRPVTGALSSVKLQVELRPDARPLPGRSPLPRRRAWPARAGRGSAAVMVVPRTRLRPRARSPSAKARLALACSQCRLRLLERGLERPAVDGEQRVAGLDHLSVAEVDGVQVAGDARAHLDRVDRDEAADVFLLVRHHLLHRMGDGDLRRRRRRSLAPATAIGRSRQAARASSGSRRQGERSGRRACETVSAGEARLHGVRPRGQ